MEMGHHILHLMEGSKYGVRHGKKKLLHEKCSKIGFFGYSAKMTTFQKPKLCMNIDHNILHEMRASKKGVIM